MTELKVHYRRASAFPLACGRRLRDPHTTHHWAQVTCRTCRRVKNSLWSHVCEVNGRMPLPAAPKEEKIQPEPGDE